MHQLRRLRARAPERGDFYLSKEIYEIDPNKCTEYIGHFDEPQRVQVCPVACIPVDSKLAENRETLWEKYRRLQAVIPGVAARSR